MTINDTIPSNVTTHLSRPVDKTHVSGMALVLVLWFIVMLTVMALGLASMSRSNALITRQLTGSVQAHYLAEAATQLIMANLLTAPQQSRLLADGSSHEITLDNGVVVAALWDESGKIDINMASEELLTRFFTGMGADEETAQGLAGAIADWRDSDSLPRLHGAEEDTYMAAGLSYTPDNKLFGSTVKLLAVLGMTPEFFAKIEPYLTVYSRVQGINPRVASMLVLLAVSDDDASVVESYVQQRQENYLAGLAQPPAPLVARQFLARGKPDVYTLTATATTSGGVQASQLVVFRLKERNGGVQVLPLDYHPYVRQQNDSADYYD